MSGKYVLEFALQGLPKMTNTNAKTHWRVQLGEARKWKRAVALATLPFKPAQPLISAALTLTRVSSHPPDADGLVSSFKHVIDGLVKVSILEDDKMNNIGIPDYRWIKGPRNKGHILIKVEEK